MEKSSVRKFCSFTSRGCLRVRLQRVWRMAADTGLAAFGHKGVGLQLRYQLGVTVLAYAQRRLVSHVSCGIAMARGALDLVRTMRTGFPFGIRLVVPAGTLSPGG